MKMYERTIGFRTVYVTLLRRLEWVFLIFVPITLGSFVVSNVAVKKTYQSSISISNLSTHFSTTTWPVFQTYAKRKETLSTVVALLDNKSIKHSDGTKIEEGHIKNGLSFTAINANSNPVSFSFSTSDSKIAKDVLTEVAVVTIQSLKEDQVPSLTNLNAGEASSPVKTSKENTYFLIGMAAGLALGLLVPFVWEIVADQVYDERDITFLDAEGFELKAAK